MPAISRVTSSEENDARPTYACAIAAGIALIVDQVIRRNVASHTRTLYITAMWIFLLAAVFGLNCLMNCIWHPIPKERRADGQLTDLHLNERSEISSTASAPTFSSLDQQITSDDDESVDSSQVELRDP